MARKLRISKADRERAQRVYDLLRRPPLYADGVHDDTDALQWRIDHGENIIGGTYAISRSLAAKRGGPPMRIERATFLSINPSAIAILVTP